jgi:hypothetical protein
VRLECFLGHRDNVMSNLFIIIGSQVKKGLLDVKLALLESMRPLEP